VVVIGKVLRLQNDIDLYSIKFYKHKNLNTKTCMQLYKYTLQNSLKSKFNMHCRNITLPPPDLKNILFLCSHIHVNIEIVKIVHDTFLE
jgi:hypothetical protein